MKCSIQLGFASLNRTFHLPPHENNCTNALITIHYLYIITRCIYIDNGMKVKRYSGCSLIECDIYFKESES